MTGPCICGDPACGRCFHSGQTRVECPACGWKGKQHECDTFCDAVTGEPYCETACPMCEVACVENEPDYNGRDGSLEEDE